MTVTAIIALEFTYWLYRLKLVGLPETIGLVLLATPWERSPGWQPKEKNEGKGRGHDGSALSF